MKIYQIWYDDISKSHIDTNFISFDNTNPEKPNEFEYGVMRKIYHSECWSDINYLGILSWKFKQKTHINANTAINFINKNPGYDVYTFNPFHYAKNIQSVWLQGELCHPGILDLTKFLFTKANIDINILSIPQTTTMHCFCNYWVANKKFWDTYMSYTEKLYAVIYDNEQHILDKLFIIQADVQIKSGMFSFIFERMFSTVVAAHQFNIKPYFI